MQAAEARLKELRVAEAAHEKADCPFQPRIDRHSNNLMARRSQVLKVWYSFWCFLRKVTP